ncbi:MAG: type II toxin-antitoxin system RelE/ParE family toxin [Gemmatimonadetes bacterium]|nr:type II toxin-antitoxin system RelE/ParE family toxin [Gemmatimonadota bacterium]
MPGTEVVFYLDDDGTAPVLDALQSLLAGGQRKVVARCWVRIERLAKVGHELRRPEADYLRDGIYELRATHRRVHYRILYFFHGRRLAVLSHVIKKTNRVPDTEIVRALAHKKRLEDDPEKHTLRR